MVDGQGLTGVLDWEFADWGDPLSDIGWFCAACWRYAHPELEAGGIAPRHPLSRGYEAVSGPRIDPEVGAVWVPIAHPRWAAIALQRSGDPPVGQGRVSTFIPLWAPLH